MVPVRSADVAKLVDALRSGRSGDFPVGVRVPPSAPGIEQSGGPEWTAAFCFGLDNLPETTKPRKLTSSLGMMLFDCHSTP